MVLGCGEGKLPSSPSTLAPLASPGTNGGATARPLEDAPAPPAAEPAPPAPDAPPPPMVISITGTAGPASFTPNPLVAAVGNQVVWTNFDAVVHHIVLDNGTDVGEVATGQSTAPMTLATPSTGFHCTIHPSMVGTITNAADAPAPPPMPPDYYYTPPMYDY
jgi:plastocyanin